MAQATIKTEKLIEPIKERIAYYQMKFDDTDQGPDFAWAVYGKHIGPLEGLLTICGLVDEVVLDSADMGLIFSEK